MSLFFGATLSCNIFTFIPTNSIKTAELRKSVRSTSYLTTQPRPLSLLQLSKPWYLSTRRPQYLSPGWVFVWYLSTKPRPPPPTQYLSTDREQLPSIHHQIKLRIINQHRRSENQERLTQIHLLSPRRQTSARGLCWYQGSSSS